VGAKEIDGAHWQDWTKLDESHFLADLEKVLFMNPEDSLESMTRAELGSGDRDREFEPCQ